MVQKNPNGFLNIFPKVFARVLRLCGMLPFDHCLQRNWILTVYSIILILICIYVNATTILVVEYSDKANIEEVEIDRASTISRFVKIAYPIIKSLIPFVALLNTLSKRRFMYKFSNYVGKSDELVEVEEPSEFLRTQIKFATRLVVLCLSVSLTAKLSSILSLVFLREIRDWKVMSWVVLLYSVDTVGFVAEMQFVLMSVALRTRFVQINEKLVSLFSELDNDAEMRIQTFAENQKRVTNTPVFALSYKSNNYSKETPTFLFEKEFLPVKRKLVEKREFVKSLERLRLRHRYLSAALHYLNVMFEYVLLVSVFSLFIMILLNIYSAIFGLARDLLLSHLSDICFWLLSSLFRLICPLVASDFLVYQARRSVELLSAFATRDLSDASLKVLQEFGHEVESRKLRVTCAFNLFIVKTELLTAAVAAGTTYIVTLIQLH